MPLSSTAIPDPTQPWQTRIGWQRQWSWRGWQIRYSFYPPAVKTALPPLLLVHGFGAAIEHWRYNLAPLAAHCPVYAIDLLGFGGSRKADTRYSAFLWAEQLQDFCQEIIGQPAVLVGHSLGSLAAVTTAAQASQWVNGLILISLPDVMLRQQSVPKPMRPWLEKIEAVFSPRWLLTAIFNFVKRPGVIQRWARLAYGDCDEKATLFNDPSHSTKPEKIDPELVEIIVRPLQEKEAIAAFQQLFHSVREPGFASSMMEVLPTLTCPVLLLWGGKDQFVPSRFGESFAALNPCIELQVWPGVGHCLQDEAPGRFNQTCLDWLQAQFASDM